MIAIVDYGVGNLFSLESSFAAIGVPVAGFSAVSSFFIVLSVDHFSLRVKHISRDLSAFSLNESRITSNRSFCHDWLTHNRIKISLRIR